MNPGDLLANSQQHSIIGISLLVKLIEGYGVDALTILSAASIDPAQLNDPKATITQDQDVRFTRAMLSVISDPDLGFHAGQCFRISAFGALGLAAASAEKVIDAIQFFLRYIQLSYTHFDVSFFQVSGKAVLRFKDRYDLQELRQFYLERDFSFVVVSTRDMFPRSLVGQKFKAVHFDFSCPEWDGQTREAHYELLYGCPVKFSMPHNEILFDEGYLGRPLPQSNPLTHKLLEAQCEAQKVETIGPESYTEKMRYLIRRCEGAIPSLEDMANEFNTTSRTLRRKLKTEGGSFQGLLSEELSRKAIYYLETTTLTVEQIAFRLGYSESASFIHAFKRWTGKAPKAFRR